MGVGSKESAKVEAVSSIALDTVCSLACDGATEASIVRSISSSKDSTICLVSRETYPAKFQFKSHCEGDADACRRNATTCDSEWNALCSSRCKKKEKSNMCLRMA